MLYVTVDVHGEHRWSKRCLLNVDKLTKEDILFVCGDFGHLHRNEDLWRKQTVLWFDVRNMQTNESVFDEEGAERYF